MSPRAQALRIGRIFKLPESVPVFGRSAMGFSRSLASAVVIILLVAAVFGVVASASVVAQAFRPSTGLSNPASAIPQLPFSKSNKYFDPALQGASGQGSVLVAMDASSPVQGVARFLVGARSRPEIGDVRMLRGLIDSTGISEVQSLPDVVAVLKHRPIAFDGPGKPTVISQLPGSPGRRR